MVNIDTDNYRTVGQYLISKTCKKLYPCRHEVIDTQTGTEVGMSGTAIYTMLLKDGLSDSHFDEYKEYIRKQEHPTPEEIAETQKRVDEMNQLMSAQKNPQEENDKKMHQFKASSRLDKLKAKNNIAT